MFSIVSNNAATFQSFPNDFYIISALEQSFWYTRDIISWQQKFWKLLASVFYAYCIIQKFFTRCFQVLENLDLDQVNGADFDFPIHLLIWDTCAHIALYLWSLSSQCSDQ